MSATTVAAPDTSAVPGEPETPSRGRTRPLLLVLLVVVLLGGATWWFLLAEQDAEGTGEVAEGVIVKIEPLTTTTGAAGIHHARVGIALVLTADGEESAIAPQIPLLQDALLQAVAGRDADTLRSAEGSDGLRAELTTAAQRIWSEDEISRVVLTELLVQ